MRIVILGAPGSGKKTQTALAAEKYGLSSVMTGELVKSAVQEQTPLGIEIKALQDEGRVVTEDIILALLREQLLKRELQEGFILDGFPRNLLQALTLDELMIEIDQPFDLILLIDIETDTLMERLVGRRTCRSCGLLYNIYRNPPLVDDVCDDCGGRLHVRSDDNEETVSNKIHVFDHLISPLITHYEKQGKLVRIDGNGEIDQVFQLICKAIDGGSRAEVPIVQEPVSSTREDSLVAEEPGEWPADEVVAVSSAKRSELQDKESPAQTSVVKKPIKKKAKAKTAVKKQAGKKKPAAKKAVSKKKPSSQPPSKARTVKKKTTKKKVSTTKHKTKLSPKAKSKTVSVKKGSKKSLKTSRSTTQKAKKKVAAKGGLKKKTAKKAVLKKTASNAGKSRKK